jgi:hypothetical protein
VEAKKRNQRTEAFVRQLLKVDKAGKLESFKDIPSAKEEKGAEEEEEEDEEEEVVVDSKRTKKKMDLSAGPSNVGPANPGPLAPTAIEAPAAYQVFILRSESLKRVFQNMYSLSARNNKYSTPLLSCCTTKLSPSISRKHHST